jgi:hypothetical protein
MNLDPLMIFKSFIHDNPLVHQGWSLATLKAGIRDSSTLQPAFNILLTVPFGMYLRYYFQRSFKQVFLMTFALTVFFELTQLSALYGLYSRPYRLIDVDDLMFNTLGGVIGYYLAPMMSLVLPQRDQVDEALLNAKVKVTLVRRFVAFVIDWLIIDVISGLAGLIHLGIVVKIILVIALLIILPVLRLQTPGQGIVHLKMVNLPSFWAGAQRFILGTGVPLLGLHLYARLLALTGTIAESDLDIVYGALLAMLFPLVLWLLDLTWSLIHRGRPLWFERLLNQNTIVEARA